MLHYKTTLELTIPPSKRIHTVRDKYGDVQDDASDEADSEDLEEEDEEGELVTPEVDAQILKTIAMIQAKDPTVYQPESQFFDGRPSWTFPTPWPTSPTLCTPPR